MFAGALLAAFAALGVVPAAGALATSLPVVSANTNGWHGQVRPHHIYVGQGGSPFVKSLRWTHWSAYTAHAAGRVVRQIPGCTKPSYQCPVSNRYVSVTLSRVVQHGSRSFFSRMRWVNRTSSGKRFVRNWKFAPEGGTVPGWH